MTEADYLEFRFIATELNRFGIELRELMVRTISSKDIVSKLNVPHTRDNISFNVTEEGQKGGRIQFLFPDKGRLVEIMFRKSGSRAKLSSRASAKTNKSTKSRAKSGAKKDTLWYNSTAFSSLNTLFGRIMYGYTEATIIDLKQKFTDYSKT
jgi:hypothetical protein